MNLTMKLELIVHNLGNGLSDNDRQAVWEATELLRKTPAERMVDKQIELAKLLAKAVNED